MDNNLNQLNPKEYFNILKEKKKYITDKDLLNIYDNCLTLLNKYKITGQVRGMKKLIFLLETIEKELDIVRMGVDTFIYRDDIENYIDNITNDVVKIIELENYEREIPDEIVEIISLTKNKFDKMYVLFTDYTGKIEKQIKKERDPILFGTFQDQSSQTVIDRFYYLGDWQDEYCDLTLEKMVNETENKTGENITKTISTPKDIEELKKQLKQLSIQQDGKITINNSTIKKNFYNKIKTFLTRK